MKQTVAGVLCAAACIVVAACTPAPNEPASGAARTVPDPHGCLVSAGYQWCAKKQMHQAVGGNVLNKA
jgi:hypothetical protein